MIQLSLEQKSLVLRTAQRFGADSVKVFGSRARGDARRNSDLDLLVRFKESVSLLKVIAFKQALEEELRLSVDIVEEEAIPQRMLEAIRSEATPL
jgi:predicted nucleotidyltransferase